MFVEENHENDDGKTNHRKPQNCIAVLKNTKMNKVHAKKSS
jgi:hypothetical protein